MIQQSRPAVGFNFERLEHPWLVKQTETHLIFGFFARRVPLIYAALIGGAVFVAWSFLIFANARPDYVDALLLVFSMGFSLYLMARASRLQQAIIGWIAAKFALLMAAISFLAVLTPMNFRAGHRTPGPIWRLP